MLRQTAHLAQPLSKHCVCDPDSADGLGRSRGAHVQWDVKKEAALSRIVEQRMSKEAVEAENAANNAKLAEHLVHVSALSPLIDILAGQHMFCVSKLQSAGSGSEHKACLAHNHESTAGPQMSWSIWLASLWCSAQLGKG